MSFSEKCPLQDKAVCSVATLLQSERTERAEAERQESRKTQVQKVWSNEDICLQPERIQTSRRKTPSEQDRRYSNQVAQKDKRKHKQVCIKREQSGRWFAIFSVEQKPEKLSTTGRAVGIDLNTQNYLTDSEGGRVEHPHELLKLEERVKIQQRKLSRKKKGSKNWIKQASRLARVHERISDRRRDFLHKLSRYYIENYDLIAVEDLAVKEMIESSYNAKNKADSAWSTFIQMLSYKAEGAGRTLVKVDPKNTSQICSRCGAYVYKPVWIREHRCPTCGLVMDRDHNAAKNILNKALQEVGSGRPELTPVEMRPLLHSMGGASLVEEAGSPHHL
ncbi:MAG: hypothetical protein DRP25_01865 [Thermotoga sp.]|nr:MAG: hypothetical protein DRP25_01865 [Thermotoga sp.]